ncbi:MAG: chloride channel protein [Bacteroidota bacterium]|nr:MAG: chloride channel protein [Bacteroidota bacterium]
MDILQHTFRSWLLRIIAWKEKRLTHRQFIYILSFIIGIVSSLAAVLLKNTVHFTHNFLFNQLPIDRINFVYLLFPIIGIILTVYFVKYFVKDNIGHGISRILFAISKKGASLRKHNTYSSLVASTLTVGFGGSVGLEAPIVLTGSSMGSSLGDLFKLNYKTKTILIGCGAAGAIAGIFKAPIAAVIFALEVLMLDLTMWSLIPLLISAVTGLTVSYFLLGRAEIFSFELVHPFMLRNIPYFMLLGVFAGFVSLYFTRGIIYIEGAFKRFKNNVAKWITGGVLLGLIILIFPPLYGEGYLSLDALLNGNPEELTYGSVFYGHAQQVWVMVLFLALILIFKVAATAITTGAGGVGGIFAPTLFMGGIAGYLVARVINLFSFIQVSERNFAVVGMAGLMAGVMHAPLTAVFLIAEITGGYELFIPLLITSTIAYITIIYFEPHSIYHKRLAERKELITHHKDQAVLTLIKMEKLIETDFEVIHPQAKLRDLIESIARSRRNIFPVVDQGMLIGVVLLDDIRHLIFNSDLYDSASVRDLMFRPPAVVEVNEAMDDVMLKFETTDTWNLPVLRNGVYVGFISKSKLFSAYRNRLIEITGDV